MRPPATAAPSASTVAAIITDRNADTNDSSMTRRALPGCAASIEAVMSAPANFGNSRFMAARAAADRSELIERRTDACVEGPHQHDPEHRDRDQTRNTRHRIVDS